MTPLASFPSPSTGVLHLGPLPLRAYAACILLGVVVAVVLGERRWVARGGTKGLVTDVASVGVPCGLVGGRIYHVVTSPDAYFGRGGEPLHALFIWRGGLGIWGGILGGVLGACVVLRRRDVPIRPFADAVAPVVAVAQAIGRFGNYFNQELFGRPTTLPWALRIDPQNRPPGYARFATFHPTFLYESLWDLGVAALVVWASARWRLQPGKAFALYVAAYTVGRSWIEALRIDDAHHLFGLRLNDYVSAVVFLAALVYLLRHRDRPAPDRQAPTEPADVPSAA